MYTVVCGFKKKKKDEYCRIIIIPNPYIQYVILTCDFKKNVVKF